MTAAQRQTSTSRFEVPRDDDANGRFLDHLRQSARAARCKSYVDLFGACALLSRDPRIASLAATDFLMRSLSQALGQRPVLFRPGETETSFDEDWLLALARSLKTDDVASATFLLHSRVPKHARRTLVSLLHKVVDTF